MWKIQTILLFIVYFKQSLGNGWRTFDNIGGMELRWAKTCDWNKWEELGYVPEYKYTCTNKYWVKKMVDGEEVLEEHLSSMVWCPNVRGDGIVSWTHCRFWNWSYWIVNNFLGHNKKEYSYGEVDRFNHYRYARQWCLDKGRGWDLASFQTMFNTSLGEIHQDDNYYLSMGNIRSILDILKGLKYDDRPLVFWVRNDQAFSHMGKYERAKNLHYTARNCLVYDMKSDEVRFEDCDKHERDIVCEYDQARMY